METLREGSSGADVVRLQESLKKKGFSPGKIDGDFGPATFAAVAAFQKSEGLLPDGIAGPLTLKALGLNDVPTPLSVIPGVTVSIVSKMFPSTPLDNIKKNLPVVCGALSDADLMDKPMVLMALATIRAETESFMPINEGTSRFNTSPGGHPFDLYDNRRDLGNQGNGDGERFKGRGFIQLTGRSNYQRYGAEIGLGNGLIDDPDMANQPDIAAKLLAVFLKDKERPIKDALLHNDLKLARRLVNGGSHGLDRFAEAYTVGDKMIA